MMDQMINTTDYTFIQLLTAGLGAIGWVLVYVFTIINIRKYKYVEMPFFVALCNFAWEFSWGFLYYERVDMGWLYVWSFRIWFITDIYVF